MWNERQQAYANSRSKAEDPDDPLVWGLTHHIDPQDQRKQQSEEGDPLFSSARRRRSGDDDDGGGESQNGSMGGLLAVVKMALPLVLLFLIVALLSKYSGYLFQFLSTPGGDSATETHEDVVPGARYCLRKMSGEMNVTTGNHSDLPKGAYTVYANFRTTKAEQMVATWGDSCAQLLLNDAGRLEYRTRSSRHSNYSTIADRVMVVTDGFWHQVAVVTHKSGQGYMYLDGTLVAHGTLAEDPFGCAGLEEVHFEGSIESLRIFREPFTDHRIGLILEAEHVCDYLFFTTTTTATTSTSTYTSTTSMTSTTTRPWSNASELPVVVVHTPPPLPTSTATATITSTATATVTFTSTSTSTGTTTATTTATRTSTSTATTTTTTRTSTSTLTTMPRAGYLSSGVRTDSGFLEFVGAALPADGEGFTVIANIHSIQNQRRQEIISWGTADKEDGCVSLHLSRTGNLEYSELAAGSSAWTTVVAEPDASLADADWHTVAVSRSPTGITYLYVDAKPVGEGMILVPRPSNLDSLGRAAGTCGGEPSETAFDGSITGVNVFHSALTQWQLEEIKVQQTVPGRRLRHGGG
mmetsp:Transcript_3965/g.9661  ORF Transcript_3965/g.9661 Transcript_3965/m.9661 type:complete len:581 (-) Transcript_3965:109-1851(-)